MLSLIGLQKDLMLSHLSAGDTVADFTMGNGYYTLFLSQTVGESGKVYAFDIQQEALDSTQKLLNDNNAPNNYSLILDSHHNCKQYIDQPIKAGVFNLGYLPGGDKSITTKHDTTLPAIKAAIQLMDKDAILIIAAYPGHEEGEIEGEMIGQMLSTLNKKQYGVGLFRLINSPTSPYFYVVETK